MPSHPIKGFKPAPREHRSTMETTILTVDQVNQWRVPFFQRQVRVNDKVLAIAEKMKADGCSISGVITLGKLTKDNSEYIVDGQHRIEAFRISGMEEIIADVRMIHFDDMAEMAMEFAEQNSSIVAMRPDDLLRALSASMEPMQLLLRECPYIGFDNVRRGTANAIVSASAALRCWSGSDVESPSSASRGSIAYIAKAFDMTSAEEMVKFMKLCHEAWGRDPEYYRLWGNLNLILCMWLYRRVVMDKTRKGNQRAAVLTPAEFRRCLMGLSASESYLEWLVGRLVRDSDRGPAYSKIKAIFTKRLSEERDGKILLPQPAWASR